MNSKRLLEELNTLLTPEQINTNADELYDAAADRYKKYAKARKVLDVPSPVAIVYPKTAEEVASVLQYCNENGVNVIPRSGKTATEGGLENWKELTIVLDSLHLDKILKIDTYNSQATAQAGVALQTLEDELRKVGYTTGHSPQSKPVARTAFFIGFFSSALLVLAAYVCNRKMTVIHDPFVHPKQAKVNAKTKVSMVISVLRQPEFRVFVIPNTLRGVTIGILNSLVLIALELGVSAKTAANLAMAGSIGYLLGSLSYNALSRVMQPKRLGLLGAGLLCAVVFLPYSGKEMLFLIIAMLGYMGRTLVDYAVPSMVFQLIDPAVSGVYNAWRTVLFSVAAAAMSFLVGALLGKIPTVALLVLCAGAYLICAVWYSVSINRFIKKPASDEGGLQEP